MSSLPTSLMVRASPTVMGDQDMPSKRSTRSKTEYQRSCAVVPAKPPDPQLPVMPFVTEVHCDAPSGQRYMRFEPASQNSGLPLLVTDVIAQSELVGVGPTHELPSLQIAQLTPFQS